MKLWSRFVLGSLALALALSLCASPASAAKKKKETKKETKKAAPREERRSSPSEKRFISGTNLEGRSGLFYGDTSYVAPKDAVEGSIHATFTSPYTGVNVFGFPVGAHLGIAENLELSAALQPYITSATGGSSTNLTINAGGKYKIRGQGSQAPDFGVGGQIYIPTYTGGQVTVLPSGTISYVLNNGMLLNGELGIGISTITYVVVDAGVVYPVSPKVSLIGEIGANQAGYLGSMFAAGARFDLGGSTRAQALLGIPLNGGGVVLGAGLILASY